MKKYMVFTHYRERGLDSKNEDPLKWEEWFQKYESRVVDRGSHFTDNYLLNEDGTYTAANTRLTGYMIVLGDDFNHVKTMLLESPLYPINCNYEVEVYDIQ